MSRKADRTCGDVAATKAGGRATRTNGEGIDAVMKFLRIRERLMVRLATGGGGMRPSEIVGLQVRDMQEKISIERRVYRGKIGRPKNRKSERPIPLIGRAKALWEEYRKLLVDDSPGAWVFPSENLKTPVSYSNVYRRYIKPALLKCGLVGIN